MDLAFFDQPVIRSIGAEYAIAIVSGLVAHIFVKSYGRALILGTLTAVAINGIEYAVDTGQSPPWILLLGWVAAYGLFVAAVGIPFHRRRTGHGLDEQRGMH